MLVIFPIRLDYDDELKLAKEGNCAVLSKKNVLYSPYMLLIKKMVARIILFGSCWSGHCFQRRFKC